MAKVMLEMVDGIIVKRFDPSFEILMSPEVYFHSKSAFLQMNDTNFELIKKKCYRQIKERNEEAAG